MLHKGKKVLNNQSLANYIKNNGYYDTTLDFTKEMASYNKKHGLRTRESVVVGAMFFAGKLQSMGATLPYSGLNDSISKKNWGIYKYWGGAENTFIACNPYIIWSYKNAGLNIYADRSKMRKYCNKTQVNKDGSTQVYKEYHHPSYNHEIRIFYFFVGVMGSTNELGDNVKPVHEGRPGDVLQNGRLSGHEMLLVDRYDDNMDGVSDGYIVLQSRDIGLCYEKRPYERVILYDMTKVFDNTANFANLLLGWQQYYIPESDYPDYLK
jgi:hypothetical protein